MNVVRRSVEALMFAFIIGVPMTFLGALVYALVRATIERMA